MLLEILGLIQCILMELWSFLQLERLWLSTLDLEFRNPDAVDKKKKKIVVVLN